jgi:hypothetical protein
MNINSLNAKSVKFYCKAPIFKKKKNKKKKNYFTYFTVKKCKKTL